MRRERRQRKQATAYIEIERKNCDACWKCIPACPKMVIGKIDIFFHKHARIRHGEKCNGCLKCIKACEKNAIRKAEKIKD